MADSKFWNGPWGKLTQAILVAAILGTATASFQVWRTQAVMQAELTRAVEALEKMEIKIDKLSNGFASSTETSKQNVKNIDKLENVIMNHKDDRTVHK